MDLEQAAASRGTGPRRIVLLAPPGAGKSTQAERVSARLGVPHVVVGDLLREEVAAGTDLGRRVGPAMDSGDLAPDGLVLEVLAARLARPDARRGFVLDGFPRSPEQAEALERMAPVDLVVGLSVPDEELIRRISSRVPPRPDDRPEVVRHRLEVYRRETEPLLAHYRRLRLLVEVDGTGDPDQVGARVIAVCT